MQAHRPARAASTLDCGRATPYNGPSGPYLCRVHCGKGAMTGQRSPLQTASGLPSLAELLGRCDFARLAGANAPTTAHLLRIGANLLSGDSRPEAKEHVAQVTAVLTQLEKQDG